MKKQISMIQHRFDITFNGKKQFEIPTNYSEISLCPNIPISLSDQSLPGK